MTLGALFVRFLRFGCLAWGGPVAQIGMLQRELVEEERWVTPEKFNRVYAVYQALPGPEAHELCVYFGTLARGRLGGLLAGLGFMLPGLLAMLAFAWFYVRFGIADPTFTAVFAGVQAAVLALIVRAVHRIGKHALADLSLWIVALAAAGATFAGVHFLVTLALAGIGYEVLARGRWVLGGGVALLLALAIWHAASSREVLVLPPTSASAPVAPSLGALFGSGLGTGLLTFGGAYTAIPLLLHDAVDSGGWMTRAQFLDGIALGGVLPAPLVIFATFVGYVARGLLGALVITAGIFLPAFGFTLLGHELFERLTDHPGLRRFLAGVTAGVVGLIATTTVELAPSCIRGTSSIAIFAAALAILYAWRSKLAIPLVIGLASAAGFVLFRG